MGTAGQTRKSGGFHEDSGVFRSGILMDSLDGTRISGIRQPNFLLQIRLRSLLNRLLNEPAATLEIRYRR
jgi:hypothetical protein